MLTKVLKIGDLVEKPAIDEAPSSLIIIGRYVLTVDIFEGAQLIPGAGGELQLTDAIRVAQRSPLHGVKTMVNVGIQDSSRFSHRRSGNGATQRRGRRV